MTATWLDVWDVNTFDQELTNALEAEVEVLFRYELTRKDIHREQQAATKWTPSRENPYAAKRQHVLEHIIMPMMQTRAIRAWHYTRLTDEEVAYLRSDGIEISGLEGIRRRLDAQVAAGIITADVANTLYGASPFHHQKEARSGKFWMTSHPFATGDRGVELLLAHWGGEGVYFWLEDGELIEIVKGIGLPRVVEVAVPLESTTMSYSAARAVIAAFLKERGCEPEWPAFDLFSESAMLADAVLRVHTLGELDFAALADGYPARYSRMAH